MGNLSVPAALTRSFAQGVLSAPPSGVDFADKATVRREANTNLPGLLHSEDKQTHYTWYQNT